MKVALTKATIDAYADALASEGAVEASAQLKALSTMFQGLASRPMTELLGLLDKVQLPQDQPTANSQDAPNALVISSLRNLEGILKRASTTNRVNDLIAFRTGLQRHESANVRALAKAVQFLRRGDGGTVSTDQYTILAEKLKAALGRDDEFNPLYELLEELDAEGVARVARALMSSGTSRSRKRDLQRIQERHESQRSLLAKQRAMAGRSAA